MKHETQHDAGFKFSRRSALFIEGMQALLAKYRSVHAAASTAQASNNREGAAVSWKDGMKQRLQQFFDSVDASRDAAPPVTAGEAKDSDGSGSASNANAPAEAISTSSDSDGVVVAEAPAEPGPTRLALLFIIIDSLPHECIWRSWLELGGDALSSRVDIYVHAKHPELVSSAWVRQRLVPFNLKPEWGSVELTMAMMRMLEHALRADASGHVAKFCLLSESCVPVCSLEETIDASLTNSPECSWINYRYNANNGFAMQAQFVPLQEIFPPKCVAKADQWLLLSRPHVEKLLKEVHGVTSNELWRAFRSVKASDEMYIPTLLATHCVLPAKDAPANPLVLQRRVTFCDWSVDVRNPKSYNTIEPDVVQTARDEGCLFMRKLVIKKDIGIDAMIETQLDLLMLWLTVVHKISSEDQIGSILNNSRTILDGNKELALSISASKSSELSASGRDDAESHRRREERFASGRDRDRDRDGGRDRDGMDHRRSRSRSRSRSRDREDRNRWRSDRGSHYDSRDRRDFDRTHRRSEDDIRDSRHDDRSRWGARPREYDEDNRGARDRDDAPRDKFRRRSRSLSFDGRRSGGGDRWGRRKRGSSRSRSKS